MTIPKILHFTWKSRELPKGMQRLYDKWRALHPDWDVRLYTDGDMRAFMEEHFAGYLPLFDAYPKQIQRVDAFRYFVLAREGGVYSDLDVDPLGNIDSLLERADCFVGVEPESHSAHGPDGVPYQLCNALMGSVPGHPFWQHVFAVLEQCKHYETLLSTGPRMLNGAGLTAEREIRPAVLAADYWSPMDFYGRKRPASGAFTAALKEQFTIIGDGEPALTSHLWNATWTMGPLRRFLVNREKGPEGQWYNLHNRIKWARRRARYPEIAEIADTFPAIEHTYGDQMLRPYGEDELPKLCIAVDADGADVSAFATVLKQMDYPRGRAQVAIAGEGAEALAAALVTTFPVQLLTGGASEAERHNVLAEHAAECAQFCLFIGGRLAAMPPDAVRTLLAARRPVVAGNCGADGLTYRYEDRSLFKRFYRQGGIEGTIDPQRDGGAYPLDHLKHMRIAPLDCVGAAFLLVDCTVLRAGVRFAVQAYKLHEDARGFAIIARERGFAVCGLPGLRVPLHPKGAPGVLAGSTQQETVR